MGELYEYWALCALRYSGSACPGGMESDVDEWFMTSLICDCIARRLCYEYRDMILMGSAVCRWVYRGSDGWIGWLYKV